MSGTFAVSLAALRKPCTKNTNCSSGMCQCGFCVDRNVACADVFYYYESNSCADGWINLDNTCYYNGLNVPEGIKVGYECYKGDDPFSGSWGNNTYQRVCNGNGGITLTWKNWHGNSSDCGDETISTCAIYH
jgi:hypothetical protein